LSCFHHALSEVEAGPDEDSGVGTGFLRWDMVKEENGEGSTANVIAYFEITGT
jgi:hypothetical protein